MSGWVGEWEGGWVGGRVGGWVSLSILFVMLPLCTTNHRIGLILLDHFSNCQSNAFELS